MINKLLRIEKNNCFLMFLEGSFVLLVFKRRNLNGEAIIVKKQYTKNSKNLNMDLENSRFQLKCMLAESSEYEINLCSDMQVITALDRDYPVKFYVQGNSRPVVLYNRHIVISRTNNKI